MPVPLTTFWFGLDEEVSFEIVTRKSEALTVMVLKVTALVGLGVIV